MDGRQCPKCGEVINIRKTGAEPGKALTREVWHCDTCQADFVHWVEIKHKPFSRE